MGYKIFRNPTTSDGYTGPVKFPFCDVFVYKYDVSTKRFIFRDAKANYFWPQEYFGESVSYSNGTYLKTFGNFQMRVYKDALNDLERLHGEHWWDIGETRNFDHRTMTELKTIQFLIPPDLHVPAKPFV